MNPRINGVKNTEFYKIENGSVSKVEVPKMEITEKVKYVKPEISFSGTFERIPLEAFITESVAKMLSIEISFEELLEIVSEATLISKELITGKSREDPMVRARYLLSIKAYEYYIRNKSLIAKKLNRDHSTIISGMKRMEGEIDVCKDNPQHQISQWNYEIEEKIKDLMIEKIIFAALDAERRIKDAS